MAGDPIICRWNGKDKVMVPQKRFHDLCAKQFVDGGDYEFVWKRYRSMKSHRHYFAELHPAWFNLPESIAKDYPTEEIFRKQSLIEVGYCTVSFGVYATEAEAERCAAHAKVHDVCDRYEVSGRVVTRKIADSQRIDAMSDDEFQVCKTAVLDLWCSMLGVTLDQLQAMARSMRGGKRQRRSLGMEVRPATAEERA